VSEARGVIVHTQALGRNVVADGRRQQRRTAAARPVDRPRASSRTRCGSKKASWSLAPCLRCCRSPLSSTRWLPS
jgi:hypothetical protein